MNKPAIDWKKVSANHISDTGLVSRYTKKPQNNSRKNNKSIRKWSKGMNRHLPAEDSQMASEHMKTCSASFAIKEMQIKTMTDYRHSPIRMAECLFEKAAPHAG